MPGIVLNRRAPSLSQARRRIPDLCVARPWRRDRHIACDDAIRGSAAVRAFEDRNQPRRVASPLQSERAKMSTQGLERLCALPDQTFPDAQPPRGLIPLHRPEAHRWPRCRRSLLARDAGLPAGGRDPPPLARRSRGPGNARGRRHPWRHCSAAPGRRRAASGPPRLLAESTVARGRSLMGPDRRGRQTQSSPDQARQRRSPAGPISHMEPRRPTLAHRCRRGEGKAETLRAMRTPCRDIHHRLRQEHVRPGSLLPERHYRAGFPAALFPKSLRACRTAEAALAALGRSFWGLSYGQNSHARLPVGKPAHRRTRSAPERRPRAAPPAARRNPDRATVQSGIRAQVQASRSIQTGT